MNIIPITIPRSNYAPLSFNKIGIVMHWMDGELIDADARFSHDGSKVSAQYGIGRDGTIHQYVREDWEAFHSGNQDHNRYWIGIEHAGSPTNPPSQVTLDISAQLIAEISRRWKISPSATTIIRHSQVVATECPGTLDVEYIIQKANLILNSKSMKAPFNVRVPVEMQGIPASTEFHYSDGVVGDLIDQDNDLVFDHITVTHNGAAVVLPLSNANDPAGYVWVREGLWQDIGTDNQRAVIASPV